MGLLRRSPSLARLLAAEVISPLGDAMGTVALVLHLQRVQGTGTAVATVLIAESLPPVLSPYLGALADRYAGRRLLIACALAQAGLMALAAAALPALAGLFALVLVRATFAAIANPAMGAAVPELVDDEDLPAANSLLGGARELGTIFGPAMAGVLFASLGVRGVLALDAITFLATVPLVATLALPRRAQATRMQAVTTQAVTTQAVTMQASTMRADAVEGMRHLWRTPVLRALAIGFWLTVLASASDDLLLVFLGIDDLHAGPAGVGILLAAASVGLVAGLVAIARWGRRLPTLGAILAGFAITATGNLLTAAAPVLAVALATQAIRGGGIALLEANVRTFVQRETPRHLRGRVLANLYGGVSVAAAAGYLLGGPLLDATSARTMFVVIGVAGLTTSAVAAVLVRASRDEGAP